MPKKIKLIETEKSSPVNNDSIILPTHLHRLYKIFLSLKSIYRFKSVKNLPVILEDIYQTMEDSVLETVNRQAIEELYFIFSNEMKFKKIASEKSERTKIELKYSGEKNFHINIRDNEAVKRHMATYGAIEIKRRDFFTGKIKEEIKSVETVKNGFEVTVLKTPTVKKENIERRKKELLERLEKRKKKIKKQFISQISENSLKSKIKYLFKVENKRTLKLEYVQRKVAVGDSTVSREEIEEIFQVRNLFGTLYVLNKLAKK